MKIIVLLLLTSCASTRQPIVLSHAEKIMVCMERFADHGFNADGVIKLCSEAYKERK